MRSSFLLLLSAVVSGFVSCLVAPAIAVAQPAVASAAFRRVIETYVAGDTAGAVAGLDAWWSADGRLGAKGAKVVDPLGTTRLGAELTPAAVVLHLEAGVRALNDGLSDTGIRYLDIAAWIADSPAMLQVDTPATDRVRRGAYLTRAWVDLSRLDIEPLNRLLARARTKFPGDAEILFASGVAAEVSTEGARLADAERHYRQAIEADPSHVDARLRLARILWTTGRLDQARAELRTTIQSIEASPDAERLQARSTEYLAHLFLGGVEAQAASEPNAADHEYGAAIALCPQAAAARLARSQAWFVAGREDEARDLLQPLLRRTGARDLPQIVNAKDLPQIQACGAEPWGEYWLGPSWRLDGLMDRLRKLVQS